ncbi:ribose transport system ATP-binding protein [Enterococcus sp. AZ194]|uniref:sugar ABC transporter ATP-binding protein n=1 Tax=Enterococcus sp. AZ194 TaxID=2774629 RepID=UPI003F22AD17
MCDAILKMEGISKRFGETTVLNEVDFSLHKGEVHALIGGNGAGKSTLMKIMTGVYSKDSGDIYIEGQLVSFKNREDASKNGIEMIFQELSLVQSMTVAENIFLGNELHKSIVLDEKTMNEKAKDVLLSLGIDIDPKDRVETLSVGLSQMVEIAKAVVKNAKILVFDEPTASLSDSETRKLFQLINELKGKGVMMVYISHRMNEIMDIADAITILKDGKNVLTDKIANLRLEEIVSYFVGESSSGFEWKKREYSSEDPILKVNNLSINETISEITFDVKKGEILGIAGLMGSGRTEILETLFGIRTLQSGEIYIDSQKCSINNTRDAIKSGFGLVPEDRRKQGLVLSHSVKENNILPILKTLSLFKWVINEKKSQKVTKENVSSLNIKTSSIEKKISLLSGGNQQKVVISKWLNTNPKVMLLDEPTAGVDIGAKMEIINIIRDYADEGNGVVFVSSELAELLAACDRILVLYDGKIINDMKRETISCEEELQHAIQAG